MFVWLPLLYCLSIYGAQSQFLTNVAISAKRRLTRSHKGVGQIHYKKWEWNNNIRQLAWHVCTGTVIQSTPIKGSAYHYVDVIAAAHCVYAYYGGVKDMEFVPKQYMQFYLEWNKKGMPPRKATSQTTAIQKGVYNGAIDYWIPNEYKIYSQSAAHLRHSYDVSVIRFKGYDATKHKVDISYNYMPMKDVAMKMVTYDFSKCVIIRMEPPDCSLIYKYFDVDCDGLRCKQNDKKQESWKHGMSGSSIVYEDGFLKGRIAAIAAGNDGDQNVACRITRELFNAITTYSNKVIRYETRKQGWSTAHLMDADQIKISQSDTYYMDYDNNIFVYVMSKYMYMVIIAICLGGLLLGGLGGIAFGYASTKINIY